MTTPKAAKKRNAKPAPAKKPRTAADVPVANIGGGGGVPGRPRKPPASS